MDDQLDGVDFAVAAHRYHGDWRVYELAHDTLSDVETLGQALTRFPGESGAIGLVAIDEDFFVVVRVLDGRTRVLLSDATAAEEWELADSVIAYLNLPSLEENDEPEPVGDLTLLEDLGMSGADLAVLIDDDELYPDEILSQVAVRLGFGQNFDDIVGLTSA